MRDPILEALDAVPPSTEVLACGCPAWKPKSMDCQSCRHYLEYISVKLGGTPGRFNPPGRIKQSPERATCDSGRH